MPAAGVEAELLLAPLVEALPEEVLEGELDDEGELALGLLAPLPLGLVLPDELEGGAGGAGVLGEVGVLALGQPVSTAHSAAIHSQRSPEAERADSNKGVIERSIGLPYPQRTALPTTKSCPGFRQARRSRSGV